MPRMSHRTIATWVCCAVAVAVLCGITAAQGKPMSPRRGEKLYDESTSDKLPQAGGVSVGRSARTGGQ